MRIRVVNPFCIRYEPQVMLVCVGLVKVAAATCAPLDN
jgi:hypothetical protein